MSAEGTAALPNEGRPAGWLQYDDGSWAPVGYDGRVGPPITAHDLFAVARDDLAALEKTGLITEVIDIEPLEVIDVEHSNPMGATKILSRPAPSSPSASPNPEARTGPVPQCVQ
ncbi:hypothetical protein [Nocardia yunnanensis]|uniref:hypothetical protein n=1 Tax=Nocardia yunnanensis TaxID=2382165 RepID=UPI0013C4C496|nr:hypothetical protein [Nocardia yunnanensis]